MNEGISTIRDKAMQDMARHRLLVIMEREHNGEIDADERRALVEDLTNQLPITVLWQAADVLVANANNAVEAVKGVAIREEDEREGRKKPHD